MSHGFSELVYNHYGQIMASSHGNGAVDGHPHLVTQLITIQRNLTWNDTSLLKPQSSHPVTCFIQVDHISYFFLNTSNKWGPSIQILKSMRVIIIKLSQKVILSLSIVSIMYIRNKKMEEKSVIRKY